MNKKYFKFIYFILPSMTVVALSFNNCGRFNQVPMSGDFASTSSSSVQETDSEKLGIPYALLSAEQTMESMMRVTNVSAVSASIAAEYKNRYGSLAAGNDLSMANGPLMLGATSLAGEVCNSLLTTEKAQAAAERAFFGSINFTMGVNSVTDQAFEASVRGMARSYWGRNISMDELALLQGYKSEFTAALAATARTQAASTNGLMLSTCAAMLSSFDAITY